MRRTAGFLFFSQRSDLLFAFFQFVLDHRKPGHLFLQFRLLFGQLSDPFADRGFLNRKIVRNRFQLHAFPERAFDRKGEIFLHLVDPGGRVAYSATALGRTGGGFLLGLLGFFQLFLGHRSLRNGGGRRVMNRPADRAGLSFYQALRQKARLMGKKPGTEFRKGILHTGKLNQIRLGNRLKTGAVTKSLAVGLDGGRDPSGQRQPLLLPLQFALTLSKLNRRLTKLIPAGSKVGAGALFSGKLS